MPASPGSPGSAVEIALRFLRHSTNSKPRSNRTASGTTTPIPAFAPVDSPSSVVGSMLALGEDVEVVEVVELTSVVDSHVTLLPRKVADAGGDAASADDKAECTADTSEDGFTAFADEAADWNVRTPAAEVAADALAEEAAEDTERTEDTATEAWPSKVVKGLGGSGSPIIDEMSWARTSKSRAASIEILRTGAILARRDDEEITTPHIRLYACSLKALRARWRG